MVLEKIIFDFAVEKNILVGICDANPLYDLRNYIDKDIPFVNKDIDKRLNPSHLIENPKSIIVVGFPYGKKFSFDIDDVKRCKISVSAVGLDYHIRVKNILKELDNRLKNIQQFNSKIFVDSGFLPEKELAKKSGIGFQGKNSLIISKKFGSYIFLGYIILDKELIYSEGYQFDYNNCKKCNICEEACPTNAINGDFTINQRNCISFLTQQKAELPMEFIDRLNNYVYGCDICQMVCPHNISKEVEEITDIDLVMPKVKEFLELDDFEFRKKYKDTSIYWRGKKVLFRNANLAK